MRSFWFRVGFGALAVFVIGMMFVTGVRATKAKAREALTDLKTELGSELSQAALGLKDSLAFTLDGKRLGALKHLTIDRPAAGAIPEVLAVVQLDTESDAARLSGCDLVPESADQMDRFRCADRLEKDLATVGSVRFERAGIVRPLKFRPDMIEKLQKGDPFHLDADLTGPVDATVRKGSHDVVRIKADSTGAHIRVTDKNGREIVKLKADSTGFSLNVDSAAR